MSKTTGIVVLASVLGLLIAAAYGQSVQNGFVWDDEALIVHNDQVKDLGSWPAYFSERRTLASDEVLSRMYRPMQTLSFAIDWRLWDGRPGGFHASSLVLHFLVCLAIVFAFRPLVGDAIASTSALVFAIHPAVSESILGLASRGNQLYTLFGLLAVGWMLRKRSLLDAAHVMALLAFVVALLAKEPAVSLLALVPMTQVLAQETPKTKALLAGWAPFAILGAGYLVVRYAIVGSAVTMSFWGGSLWSTVQMQAKVFVAYLGLLVWPFDLQARYVVAAPEPFPDLAVLLSGALCALLAGLSVVYVRRQGRARMAAGAILWFFLSLAPVSNLIPVPGSMMAERFLYVTLAGVLPLALGALFKGRGRVPRTAAILVFVLLGGAFVVVDRQRTEIWRDNTVFFDTLAERLPDDPSTQVRQAQQELRRGDAAEAAARLEGVVQRGIVSPFAKDRASLHYWYGRALLESGRSMEAVSQFELAGRHWPDREVTLALAEALAMSGRLARATEVLVAYLPDNPRDDTAWNALGNVQWLSGDRPGAAESYRKALKINPDNVEAATNLDRLGG